MSTESWVDDDSVQSVAAKGQLDAYCNLATLVFAKIINFLTDSQKRFGIPASRAETANTLWTELQAWRDYRPKESLPLLRSERSNHNAFDTIIFTQSSSGTFVRVALMQGTVLTRRSVCGNTFYHAGSILLLRTGLIVAPGATEKGSDRVRVFTTSIFVSFPDLLVRLDMARERARWDFHLNSVTVSGCLRNRNRRSS